MAMRRRRWLWIVLALVVVALVALPLVRDQEDTAITDEVRDRLSADGHAFASLEAGSVHYELAGPEEGPLAVLVHGVSGPMEVWDDAVGPLHEAGIRTLRFDHYGRGWSARVERDYDLDLFVGSVEGLLAHVEHEGPVFLLGSSMGAIVSAEFALRHADRVERVVLLGPAGFPIEASPLAKLIKVPGVGDWMMKVAGDNSLADHNRRYFYDPAPFAAFQERFETQLRVHGSKAAILSTMRNTPVQSYLDRYAAFGALEKPTLLVWGRHDQVFPYEHHAEAQKAIPQAELVSVDEAGHLPMFEQPAAVMPEVVAFLRPE